jgi:hypothetical protein
MISGVQGIALPLLAIPVQDTQPIFSNSFPPICQESFRVSILFSKQFKKHYVEFSPAIEHRHGSIWQLDFCS